MTTSVCFVCIKKGYNMQVLVTAWRALVTKMKYEAPLFPWSTSFSVHGLETRLYMIDQLDGQYKTRKLLEVMLKCFIMVSICISH